MLSSLLNRSLGSRLTCTWSTSLLKTQSIRSYSSQIVSRPTNYFTNVSSLVKYGGRRKKRIGRGHGNKGKKAGRGTKGYKARRARATPTRGFEGGQSGIIKALPKIGRQTGLNPKKFHSKLYLDTLQYLLDTGKLDGSKAIGLRELYAVGLKKKDGVALMGRVFVVVVLQ